MARKISFETLCEEEKSKPTKLEDLLSRAATATRREVSTVKMWTIGRQMPDDLVIENLAKEFNLDFDTLKQGFIQKVEQYKSRRNKVDETQKEAI